ncbi:MAG: hypothetical protein HY461_01715 [Parcubacteria group bacterium]|nr:hypothetical protein [Parcubacteria group bacterium]
MTSEQYSQIASDFTSLVKVALKKAKQDVVSDPYDVALTMPALISLVNTVGYLRGQDGVFVDSMPPGIDHKAMYAVEDECEKELNEIIEILLKSKEADLYRRRLESYFVKSRTGGKPDVM